jgi:hypothetical protein
MSEPVSDGQIPGKYREFRALNVYQLAERRRNQSPINDIRGRAVLGRGFDRGREPSAELTVESGHHEYRSVDA